MLTPFCNSFTVKKINFTAAGQPAAPGIGLSQSFTDKGAQMASFNFIFQSTSTLPCEASPAAPPGRTNTLEGTATTLHLWHQHSNRGPQSRGNCTLSSLHPSQKPWRRLKDAAESIQDQDNTTKAQSQCIVYNTCSTLLVHTTESKNVLWLRKQLTSKVWSMEGLIQNCHRSTSLMQEWKKSVFGDIQQK